MSVNLPFLLAAIVAVVTFYVHLVIGGRVVARPLLDSTALPRASKWLNYYCWHITTWLLTVMAAGFGWAATHRDALDLATMTSAIAAGNCLLSVWAARKGGINPLRFPSTSLFALMAALGATGLATAA